MVSREGRVAKVAPGGHGRDSGKGDQGGESSQGGVRVMTVARVTRVVWVVRVTSGVADYPVEQTRVKQKVI